MTAPWSWFDAGAGRSAIAASGLHPRPRVGRAPVRVRRERLLDLHDPAQAVAGGTADRHREALPSASHGSGGRPLPPALGAAVRGARGGLCRRPGSHPARGHRDHAAAPLHRRARVVCPLLRQHRDARSHRSRVRAPRREARAVRSVPRVGAAPVAVAVGLVLRTCGPAGRGVHRRPSLARPAGCRCARQARRGRARSRAASAAAQLVHVSTGRLTHRPTGGRARRAKQCGG